MKTAILASILTLSGVTSAEELDMVPFGSDVDSRTYFIERNFYNYGTKQDGFKYKGTRLWVVDRFGRQSESVELYFDCSDSTFGFSTPTTQDLMKGTVIHQIYLKACPKDQAKRHKDYGKLPCKSTFVLTAYESFNMIKERKRGVENERKQRC
jgi:hypothetical protein